MGLKRGRKKIQEQAWARGMQTKEPGDLGSAPPRTLPPPSPTVEESKRGWQSWHPCSSRRVESRGVLSVSTLGVRVVHWSSLVSLSHSLRSITTHPSGLHLMRIPTAVDFYRPHQITLRRCKRPAWVHSPAAHGPWVLRLSCLPLGRGRCPLLSGQLQKRTSP